MPGIAGVLADLRATALDKRQQGDRLEEMTQRVLQVVSTSSTGVDPGDEYTFYAVTDKKMRFGSKNKDRTEILYNPQIMLRGIPEEAYRYQLGSRSAIEWIIDRYHVKTDKASGIVNDPNDWSREHEQPRYIIDLLKRIVTVSLETMAIVDALPDLDILEDQ